LLQGARANGCEWDEGTCSEAAWGGHLQVLQWVRANGCDWDLDECLDVAPAESEMFEWIEAQIIGSR
jgi:hypothetical protein